MKSVKNLNEIVKENSGNWNEIIKSIRQIENPECRLHMFNAIDPFEVGKELYEKIVIGRNQATDEIGEQKHNLEQMVNIDALTGLQNRGSFDNNIRREVALYNRGNEKRKTESAKNPLSIVYFDIDYFKKFNDTFGHLAGDYVLSKLGKIVKEKFRETDICCRYGGEEFALILPNTDGQGAYAAAEYLRKHVENEKWEYDDKNIGPVTISIGVAEYNGKDVRTLVKNADDALYVAKETGRNRTKRYSDVMDAE